MILQARVKAAAEEGKTAEKRDPHIVTIGFDEDNILEDGVSQLEIGFSDGCIDSYFISDEDLAKLGISIVEKFNREVNEQSN